MNFKLVSFLHIYLLTKSVKFLHLGENLLTYAVREPNYLKLTMLHSSQASK